MEREKIFKDIIFVMGVLAVSLLIWLAFRYINGSFGDSVAVVRNGQEEGRYSLLEDNVYIISGETGYNLLVISGGEAFITDADCPDGLCMKQKAISRKGESIICLPHKLVIQVEAKEESDLDAVTY